MDRLASRLSLARRTWERLDELAGKASVSDVERDVMADDRNLTVHTYNEELAKRIFGDLAGHSALLARWISAMEQPMQSSPSSDL